MLVPFPTGDQALGPVASFPLGAQELAAALHRQLLLLTALAVIQDIVVGVDAHGPPPPRAPAAALGALGPGGVPPPSHITVSCALLPRARLGLAAAEAVVDLLRLPLQPVVLGAVDLQGAVPQPALRRALAPPRDVPP